MIIEKELLNINSHKPSKDVLDLINLKNLIQQTHSLKLLTLSIGNIDYKDIQWGQEYAIRCFNNLLDRRFLTKHIKASIKIQKSKSLWFYKNKQVKDIIRGGWRKVEFKLDLKNLDLKNIGKVNVHIHAICESDYIPQILLSEVWRNVLSKPFNNKYVYSSGIIDIREIGNTPDDINTLIDYIAKPDNLLRKKKYANTRLYSKFGSWYI